MLLALLSAKGYEESAGAIVIFVGALLAAIHFARAAFRGQRGEEFVWGRLFLGKEIDRERIEVAQGCAAQTRPVGCGRHGPVRREPTTVSTLVQGAAVLLTVLGLVCDLLVLVRQRDVRQAVSGALGVPARRRTAVSF